MKKLVGSWRCEKSNPTEHISISEQQNPSIHVSELHTIIQSVDMFVQGGFNSKTYLVNLGVTDQPFYTLRATKSVD